MGRLIWVSWVPNKQKPSRIGHGSQCLMADQFGMYAVQQAKEKGLLKRGHIDLMLKDWLLQGDEAQKAGACYIYPPIGSYTEHPSECDPANFGGDKTRPSGFDSGENPCHGTRMWGDSKGRQKAMLQWRPNWVDRPWIQFEPEEDLYSTAFDWRSYEDESAAQSLSEMKGSTTNPGKSQREKRMFRSFMTRMSKRNWTKNRFEAKCVVWGG